MQITRYFPLCYSWNGIGGGVIAQGKPLRGFWNPSFGHMALHLIKMILVPKVLFLS